MSIPDPAATGNPPSSIDLSDPLSLPADRRDRELALAVARARGIEPPWAGRVRTPWQQLQDRVERLERLVLRFAAAGGESCP